MRRQFGVCRVRLCRLREQCMCRRAPLQIEQAFGQRDLSLGHARADRGLVGRAQCEGLLQRRARCRSAAVALARLAHAQQRLGLERDEAVAQRRALHLRQRLRRQRVGLGGALLHQPHLLLLDEATVGLDVQSRAGILANIRRLVATEGISVFWATHLIDEVGDGDHVVVLSNGNLVAKGYVAEVVAATGAKTIGEAFAKLSGKTPAAGQEPSP